MTLARSVTYAPPLNRHLSKGQDKKARRGELKNFTGVDSPCERSERPEIRIDTAITAMDDAAESIVAHLRAKRILR